MTLEIAMRLQKLRKEKGLSQEELADKLGVSRQAVSKWERAEASPDTDNLILLSRLYGISMDELLNSSESTEEIKEEQASLPPGEPNGEPAAQICAEPAEPAVEPTEALLKLARARRRKKIAESIFNTSVVMLTVIAYILLGALGGWWHPAWIVFLAIPVLITLFEAIVNRDASQFAYPILVTAVYLYLGCVHGWWHPSWVIFVTIPIYYAFADLPKKRPRQK